MNKNLVIDNFSGKYSFLSNFYPCVIEIDNVIYPSVEHAYQASKTSAIEDRIFFTFGTAGEAKRKGRILSLREDWELIKENVMQTLIEKKFSTGPLKMKLLETNPCILIEGNTWGDVFWGVYNGTGKNRLGEILMSIRKNLI